LGRTGSEAEERICANDVDLALYIYIFSKDKGVVKGERYVMIGNLKFYLLYAYQIFAGQRP